ncbi:MAG: hypothetical protein A2Y33_06550 [Spirochaetes bacterium GWF1_51_8]|nr:MAG: hypothetical protein A2Y33_06550 [Spirochaetes bacterium GWF1_51_8]
MTNVLLDTNVLIYSINLDSDYYDGARTIMRNPEYRQFITTKNICEFVSSVTRMNLLPYKEIMKFVEMCGNSFHILFPDKGSYRILLSLLEKYNPMKNKVFDFEIISIMLANGITRIATFNEKDFEGIQGIEIVH